MPQGAKLQVWSDIEFQGASKIYTSDTDNLGNEWNDRIRSAKLYNYFDETHDIMEPRVDWDMHWKSKWSDIYDTRSRYFYQWVSLSHDIYGKRPRYETVTVDAKVVQQKFITKWGTGRNPHPTDRTQACSYRQHRGSALRSIPRRCCPGCQ
ncbi:MAG UNVERIFIED_CONTAM: hypothetical protein LVR18_03135 [Planctomycetaceae bacterium]